MAEVVVVERFVDGAGRRENDLVASEETVALVIDDGVRFDLIVSPRDLTAMAVGFLFAEGLIRSADDLDRVVVERLDDGECLRLERDGRGASRGGAAGGPLADVAGGARGAPGDEVAVVRAFTAEGSAGRELLGRWTEVRSTGCVGVKAQYGDLVPVPRGDWTVAPEALFAAQANLVANASTWSATGGCHATGVFDREGRLLHFAEDVGRHTSVDKALGKALLAGERFEERMLVTTGRLAAAMVAKAIRAGVPLMASKAAPLNWGVRLAESNGLTLVGFARAPRLNVYANAWRLTE
ncbi:MAG: formate dehydrogenase accessory sulfurtransferase FdhD [Promethearchaeota archaeon]